MLQWINEGERWEEGKINISKMLVTLYETICTK